MTQETERGCPAPDTPTELATDTVTPGGYAAKGVSTSTHLSGLDLPAPDKSPEELIAFADGWATGYARGQVEGFAEGFATADEVLKGAITAALGQPGDDYSAAVRRANRTLAVVQYRRRYATREAA